MRALLSLAVAATFALSACSSGAPNTDGSTTSGPARAESAFPVTLEAANGEVRLEERPESIVSLSPTATEVLFAIGAGPQVEAVDDQSNYPEEAPTTDLSGFEPNVEAIAGYEPDLVVLSDDPAGVVESLEALDVPVLQQPAAADLEDAYAQIEQLGVATGQDADASKLVSAMKSDIASIVDSVPDFERAPTYFHELDDTYFTATSQTFIGQVYALLGLRNIADRAPKSGAGYLQLSQEYIIEADPDLVMLADTKCCNQSAETVAQRPGWDQIEAVQQGGVIELDDDVASRWGPRVVDFLETVAERVAELEEAPAS